MTDGTERDGEELREPLATVIDPLDTVDPDARTDELDVVGAAIGDADVIGMGEASHGTREFYRFKHRLFRHLVEAQGVRMLGIEANFAATLDVNAYVMRGEGTAEDALGGECFHGVYRTRSVLRLVEWVRSFNEGRPRDDRVRFHGFDVQHSSAAVSKLERYFEAVDPDVLAEVRDALGRLGEHGHPDFADEEALRADLDARAAVVSALGDALDDREAAYVDATSRRAYQRADRLVWTIEQGRRQFEAIHRGRADAGANVRIRDSAMAAQVQWLLGHEPVDRIALWGHNAHLTRGSFGGGTVRHRQGIPSLGKNLARLSGIDYYALGLTVGGGTVRAFYGPEREYRDYEIESPPEGSVPAVFGGVGRSPFFLDVANLPADGPLAEWLDAGPDTFDVTGGYRDSPVNLVESNYLTGFDGLVFVAESTPTRPLDDA